MELFSEYWDINYIIHQILLLAEQNQYASCPIEQAILGIAPVI
jgi:hypothetical protein